MPVSLILLEIHENQMEVTIAAGTKEDLICTRWGRVVYSPYELAAVFVEDVKCGRRRGQRMFAFSRLVSKGKICTTDLRSILLIAPRYTKAELISDRQGNLPFPRHKQRPPEDEKK